MTGVYDPGTVLLSALSATLSQVIAAEHAHVNDHPTETLEHIDAASRALGLARQAASTILATPEGATP